MEKANCPVTRCTPDLGYYYAKQAGISIGLSDMIVPSASSSTPDARKDVQAVMEQFERAHYRHRTAQYITDCWIHTTDAIAEEMMKEFRRIIRALIDLHHG